MAWKQDKVVGQSLHDLLCIHNREFSHTEENCPLALSRFEGVDKPHSGVWLNAEGDYLPVDYRMFCLDLPDIEDTIYAVSFRSTLNEEHNQYELEKLAEYTNKHPSPLAELDIEGNILFANPSFQEKMLDYGFSAEGFANFLPRNIKSICENVGSSQQALLSVDIEIEEKNYRWHFHPLEGTGAFSLLAYGFDITEQKQAEKRISEERAAARREFYAKMIHELRTPLNAIVGFSDILAMRSDSIQGRDRERLLAIKTAGLQLNDLITDTLDIAKIEAGKLDTSIGVFALDEVFKDMNVQMAALAEVKKLDYQFESSEQLQIISDSQKLRQILINLVSNAIKYTREGWVRLEVKAVTHAQLGEAIEFRVSDSGIGIPEDKIGSLFESYEQVNDAQNVGIQGTGLGLALVEQLVALLKGYIRVESEYGHGSCFILSLPADFNQ
jgi:signal transduction histidine kinase